MFSVSGTGRTPPDRHQQEADMLYNFTDAKACGLLQFWELTPYL